MGQPGEAELFSAYVDDELTPEERAAVEQRLAVDEEARALVAEYRELSTLLRSFPRAAAPAGLYAAAMRAANSSTHAGSSPQASPSLPAPLSATAVPAPRSRSNRREWVTALTAIVTTVLCAALINVQLPREHEIASRHTGLEEFGTSESYARLKDASADAIADPSEDVMLRHMASSEVTSADGLSERLDLKRRAGEVVPQDSLEQQNWRDSTGEIVDRLAEERARGSVRRASRAPEAPRAKGAVTSGGMRGATANLPASSMARSPAPEPAPGVKTNGRQATPSVAASAPGASIPRSGSTDQERATPMYDAPSSPVAKDLASPVAKDKVSLGLDAESLSADETPRDRLSFEEVLPYLALNTSQGLAVANVDLMVMDVQRGADELQVLLVKNGVPAVNTVQSGITDYDQPLDQKQESLEGAVSQKRNPTAAEKPNSSMAGKAMVAAEPVKSGAGDASIGQKQSEKPDAELIAVYVEAPSESLTKTLEELSRRREILALRLQPPLQVAQIPALVMNPSSNDANTVNSVAVPAGQPLTARQLNGAYLQQHQYRFMEESESPEKETISAVEDLHRGADDEALTANGQQPYRKTQRSSRSNELAKTKRDSGVDGTREVNRDVVSGRAARGHEVAKFNTLVRLQVPEPPLGEVDAINAFAVTPISPATGPGVRTMNIAGSNNSLVAVPMEAQAVSPGPVRVLFVLKPADTVRLNVTPR